MKSEVQKGEERRPKEGGEVRGREERDKREEKENGRKKRKKKKKK